MGIRSFAQNFEDVILWRALQDVEAGFFIDIGAQHPVKDSVSKAFSEKGWSGIHVEPVPEYADMLRADRKKDLILQAIVADHPGIFEFNNIEGTGLSTVRDDIADRHRQNNFSVERFPVAAVTLDDVLKLALSDDIHWLKIDVEGLEKAVLSGWRESDRRPWLVIVEATLPETQKSSHEEWESLLLQKGYSHVYSDGLNRFYLSDARHELLDRFDYPPNIFDGFQMVEQSAYVVDLTRRHEEAVSTLENRIVGIRNAMAQMEESAASRERHWQERLDCAIEGARQAAQGQLDEVKEEARAAALRWAAREAALEERASVLLATIDGMRQDALSREERWREHERRIVEEMRVAARKQLDERMEGERIALEELDRALQREKDVTKHLAANVDVLSRYHASEEAALSAVLSSRTWRFSGFLRLLFGERTLGRGERALDAATLQFLTDRPAEPPNGGGPKENAIFTTADVRDDGIAQDEEMNIMLSDDAGNVLDLLALPVPDFVREAYKILLGRPPAPAEQSARAAILYAGWGRVRLLADICQSREYIGHFYEGNDKAFIERLYRMYLRRSPEGSGLNHYQALLDKGKKRADIHRDILTSNEARAAGSFRYTLEYLLADEYSQRHWFRRWFGRARRWERQQNLLMEVMLRGGGARVAATPFIHGQEQPISSAPYANMHPLAQVDLAEMGPDVRRVIQRLRGTAGIAS